MISPEKTFRDMALSETKIDLAHIPEYNEVGVNDYGISEIPIVSCGYFFCGAVMIRKGRLVGLSHFTSDNDPGEFIDKMVGEMGDNQEGLKAMFVTAGSPDRFEKAFQDRRIRIVNRYIGERTEKGFSYQKDIVVKPSLSEVLIYTRGKRIEKQF